MAGRGSVFYIKRHRTLKFMKDPIGLLLALVFAGWGAAALAFPQWWYRVVTPEQAARDHKRIRTFGFIALPIGLILLALRFL